VEHGLVECAVRRQCEGCGVVPAHIATAVELAHPELGDDQRAVLRRLVSNGNGVESSLGQQARAKPSSSPTTASFLRQVIASYNRTVD
jgi:hypothetical protein